jgi:hypothetical protein
MSAQEEQRDQPEADDKETRRFVEALRLPMAEIMLCVEELEARARLGVDRELYPIFSKLADAARRAQALVGEATPDDTDLGDEPTAMFAPFDDEGPAR